MSPEQVRGEAADARSDLWALACVLFECLTGQRCFKGQTLSETFATTLSRDPDYVKLPEAVPAEVRDLLRACLSKEASQRPDNASVAVTVLQRWVADLRDGGAGSAAEGPNNLPADLTSFIGREPQLADIRKLREQHRLATLVGVGGCGKTRLSRRAAREAPGQLESRLDDAFRLLTGGSRTALPRHRTLRATIDWSYNLLSQRERRPAAAHRLPRRLEPGGGGRHLCRCRR